MKLETRWLLILVAALAIHATTPFTNGTPRPLCGSYRCIAEASCVNGECVCPENTRGLGNFICVRPDQQFAAIFNDPMVIGFDGSHVKVPLISKFLATHVSTTTCTGATPDNVVTQNGMCDFKLFPWGKRIRGKTFIGGIHALILVYTENITYHHATRIEGNAFDGQYLYTEHGTTNPFGAPPYNGPVTTFIPGLGMIHTVHNGVDHFAELVVEPCGIKVGLRGVDQLGDALAIPAGVYFTVLTTCEPVFLSLENSLFAPPPEFGPSLSEQVFTLSTNLGFPVNPFQWSVYKTLAAPGLQDFPGASVELQILSDTVQECSQTLVYFAITWCIFCVERPRFFYCYDDTTDASQAIALLGQCMFSFCDDNPFMCHDTQSKVTASGCQSKIRQSEMSILDYDCDHTGAS